MKQKGFIGPAFLYIIGIIIVLVLIIMFVAKPLKVYSENVTPPFKPKQLILAEKITYLFKKPQTGDRVIFIPQNTDSTYVGLITLAENEGDVTTYTIVSKENGRPWIVSADKITDKIYYPFLDPVETTKIALSLQATPTTSPNPESINSVPIISESSTSSTNPTSSSAQETTNPDPDLIGTGSIGANWKTYINNTFKYSFNYPPLLFLINQKDGEINNSISFFLNDRNVVEGSNYKVLINTIDSNIEKSKIFFNYGDAGFQNEAKEINTFTIDGKKAYKAAVITSELNPSTGVYSEIGKYYRAIISLNEHNSLSISAKLEDRDIVEDILSTFKFLP